MLRRKYFITLLFLIIFSLTGKPQIKSVYGLYIDRDVYVSGETLLAKIYLPEGVPSRIICLDLVNQYGSRITGASIIIRDKEAEGYLQLPDSLSSGTYLVRTYQKYNAGKLKTIHEIYISNRFDKPIKAGQLKKVATSSTLKDKQTDLIQISGLQKSYSINSPVEVGIQIDESVLAALDGSLLLSVNQAYPSYDPATYSEMGDQTKADIVEKKGIILSGMVTDRKSSDPANGITVYLTIPDSIPGFQYYKTRKDGRFYFLLDNYFGSVQTIIQCFGNSSGQLLDIKLDDRYAEPGRLPDLRLSPLPAEFKEVLDRNIATVTFQKVFKQNYLNPAVTPLQRANLYPYYGKSSQTIEPQQYLIMTNFAEISKELLRGVRFRITNNEPSLQVFNNVTGSYFEDSPLVLIDGIPIRDLKIIANLGSSEIERIDICQTERIFGDLLFPGVVAIYTKEKNNAIIPESGQLIRMNLDAIQPSYTWAEPRISGATVPDLRQVLYWNPATKPSKIMAIQCKTSTILGQYKLIIRGRLKDGTFIFSEKLFDVK